MTLKTNAAFTGKLTTEGDTASFSGKVTPNGTSAVLVNRAGLQKSNLTMSLVFDLVGGSDTMTGTVNGLNWNAPLMADRDVWFKKQEASAYTNSYTALIPGFANSSNGPSGYSWGTLSIKTNGSATIMGLAADEHKLKHTMPISKGGLRPLYLPMYPVQRIYTNLTVTNVITLKTNKAYHLGSAIGWILFTSNSLTERVSSIHTEWTNGFYHNGFYNVSALLSSRYIAPITGAMTQAIAITDATIT